MRLCNNLHVAALRNSVGLLLLLFCKIGIVINIIILSPPAQSRRQEN